MQLLVIRRLVFGCDDTILIAKTGFGKSLTFQAFTVLTGCWTIQLIPLNRLGGQHHDDAARLPDISPCLVTAETKHLNREMFTEICRQKYNYILLGPEQAVSGGFRAVLRDPNVQQCIGLVAIDELHVLHDWDFRASYPQLLGVYGCTATLTEETEKAVLRLGGFRNRDESGALSIIRPSIDRPEITLNFRPIKKGMTSCAQLYFVLHVQTCLGGQYEPTPGRIPKTIIFIDGAKLIEHVARILMGWLTKFGYSSRLARETVRTYSALTSKFDQDVTIEDFASENSHVRIIVATTAVGMGMDISVFLFPGSAFGCYRVEFDDLDTFSKAAVSAVKTSSLGLRISART
ncbi:P-loop containing nucleoside triphosphate hydrolase protein [Elaphomyces granulatus]